MNPLGLHVPSPTRAVITELRPDGSLWGSPVYVGSTALAFHGRRRGAKRGEPIRYDALTESDILLLRAFAVAPDALAVCRRLVEWAGSNDGFAEGADATAIAGIVDEARAALDRSLPPAKTPIPRSSKP